MPGNNESTPENPLAAARDRLQASAREIMRNIESAIGSNNSNGSASPAENEGSLEQAFRNFFSSCTTGAAMATADDDNTAADLTPVSTQPSQESSSSLSSKSRSRRPSCMPQQREALSTKESLRRLAAKHLECNRDLTQECPLTQPAVGEHIYEQLFFDEDQARGAAQISQQPPHNRRRRSPQGLVSPNTQPKKRVNPTLTKPFPVSSPIREKPTGQTPSEGISIPGGLTFDDEISAISAHTLDAMAREPPDRSESVERAHLMQQQRSRVTPQFPRTTSMPAAAAKQHPQQQKLKVRKSLTHHRSATSPAVSFSPPMIPHDTLQLNQSSVNSSFSKNNHSRSGTPVRYGTPQSRSTRTTQSSGGRSFELWQTSETQFWEAQVQDETTAGAKKTKKTMQRNSSRARSRTPESTLSTASSTGQSKTSSSLFGKHPHETFSYEPNDLFFNHRQLALPADTETAEI